VVHGELADALGEPEDRQRRQQRLVEPGREEAGIGREQRVEQRGAAARRRDHEHRGAHLHLAERGREHVVERAAHLDDAGPEHEVAQEHEPHAGQRALVLAAVATNVEVLA
jgi:hypothetical protein